MRDKLGWAASSPRIASAQARLAGDEELLNMMELLQKANMMSSEALSAAGLGIDHGPLTGPAHLVNDNVFDKSFVRPGDEMVESSGEETSSDTVGDQSETQSEAVFSPSNENLEPNL
jgi:protein-serine/threonine kinase